MIIFLNTFFNIKYKINCNNCEFVYISQTRRNINFICIESSEGDLAVEIGVNIILIHFFVKLKPIIVLYIITDIFA